VSQPDPLQRDIIALLPQLRAFARMLCNNPTDGDDLAQATLMRAWAARASFTPGTNLKAWLYQIARNQLASDHRRNWRIQSLDPETAERTLIATTSSDGNLELDELRRALAMLPPEQREAIILVGAGDLAYAEAALIMDVPIGTVKSRVSRARATLAGILETGDLVADDLPPALAMTTILAEVAERTAIRRPRPDRDGADPRLAMF
jgi:RNA polymerase sigma-70 factor (ECF subfamily)